MLACFSEEKEGKGPQKMNLNEKNEEKVTPNKSSKQVCF